MIRDMEPVRVKDGGTKLFAFEVEENISSITEGNIILIPSDISSVTVAVSFTGGASGYVEASLDKVLTVKEGSPIWVMWDVGEVSETTQDFAYPHTAIRAVQTATGTMKMTVRAQ